MAVGGEGGGGVGGDKAGLLKRDSMVTYEESEHVLKLLPNARLVKLEGVEHPIEKVDPNTLADYIRSNHVAAKSP